MCRQRRHTFDKSISTAERCRYRRLIINLDRLGAGQAPRIFSDAPPFRRFLRLGVRVALVRVPEPARARLILAHEGDPVVAAAA